jgi:predicted PurR-regulated permease PerM
MVLLLIGALFGIGQQLSEPASEWIQRAPKITRQLEFKLGGLRQSLEHAREATRRIQDIARTPAEPATQEVVVRGPTLAEQALTQTQLVVAHALMMLFLLFFFLAFGRPTVESVIQAMPRIDDRLQFADVVNTVQVNIAAYLATITVINIAMGILVGVAMSLLGMPNPVLWGTVAGLLNFIPYLGPAITAAILLLVALVTFNGLTAILAPPAVFLLLHGIESNLVTPTVVGRRLTLNPIAVFFTVLFWGWLWGVPGAILAVPILAVAKIICDATPSLRMVGALLGSPSEEIEPALPAPPRAPPG